MEFKDYEEEQYMPNSANDEEILIGHKQKTKSIFRIEKDFSIHAQDFCVNFLLVVKINCSQSLLQITM